MMNLNRLYQDEVIREIDLAFGRMIRRLDAAADPMVAVAAALVSRATTRGDVCLDLAALARDGWRQPEAAATIRFHLTLDQWQAVLAGSRLVGGPGEGTPMILEGRRLYLQRFWQYEQQVARGVLARCRAADGPRRPAPGKPAAGAEPETGDEDQRTAVHSALRRRFTVISGGPGTGKTYTIARIISLLQSVAEEERPRIKLAAPTGKAAARLQEALEAALAVGPDPTERGREAAPPTLPQAMTLHRLLGAARGRSRFLRDARNPVPADVVIVDEASMVDLALMAKLVQAVPSEARLILVGDKDQLASVEAGAVLADICFGLTDAAGPTDRCPPGDSESGGSGDPDRDKGAAVVVLKKNYRSGDRSAIHRLGQAVNEGDGNGALALLQDGDHPQLSFRSLDGNFDPATALAGPIESAYGPLFADREPAEALRALTAFKILSPVRKGPLGVEALNQSVERQLKQSGRIRLSSQGSPWYAGRPVMVDRNDYGHDLFNGDIGITVVENEAGGPRVRVAFPDEHQRMKYLAPEQLPAHETVYAMTVHKSQGTEFEHVLLILPDRDLPVLSRELIYTAVTRAKSSVTIWAREEIFKTAVRRRIRRVSGLRDHLYAGIGTCRPHA